MHHDREEEHAEHALHEVVARRLPVEHVAHVQPQLRQRCGLPLGAGPVGVARRCRKHRQVAVDLRAVGVDDDPAAALGQSKREGRLAACRRSGD